MAKRRRRANGGGPAERREERALRLIFGKIVRELEAFDLNALLPERVPLVDIRPDGVYFIVREPAPGGRSELLIFDNPYECSRYLRPCSSRHEADRMYIERSCFRVIPGPRFTGPNPEDPAGRGAEDTPLKAITLCCLPGKPPRPPGRRELESICAALSELIMMLKAIASQPPNRFFENGATLVRSYDPSFGLWHNMTTDLFGQMDLRAPREVNEGSTLWMELKGLRPGDMKGLELDYGWLAREDEEGFDCAVTAVDRNDPYRSRNDLYDADDAVSGIIQTFLNAAREFGLPKKLYVCRDETEDIFSDIARITGVELKRVKRLPNAISIFNKNGVVW